MLHILSLSLSSFQGPLDLAGQGQANTLARICCVLRLRRKTQVVGSNGLEPSTSRLSGVRSNHLSYEPMYVAGSLHRPTCFAAACLSARRWWRRTESNCRPPACKAGALPAELRPHIHRFAALRAIPPSRVEPSKLNSLCLVPHGDSKSASFPAALHNPRRSQILAPFDLDVEHKPQLLFGSP